ncbi:LacI family DNA-binding transcriptional regulator [Tenacibaculum amylolyticum]|uniref:LacI family DNA-binding transcriptional regulator n=1 Tax=Tenacibaculum amylolyticum TaxID=104269 RepID=UPI003893BA4E
MKKETTTLKQIATSLNLSISTVSRALNNHVDISDETKRKVKREAERLHYVPNILAKGFRKHKTNIIGIIVPSVAHSFTATILKGILLEAEKTNYTTIITETNNNPAKEKEVLHTMLQFGVEGILMALSKHTRDISPMLHALKKRPLILFDKVSSKIPCTQIVINEVAAAANAVEHLINIGKKRIAIIKEREDSYNSEKRYEGYLQALQKHNIPIDEDLILSTDDSSINEGKRLARELLCLKERPDAIFCITDAFAIGVIKTLKKFKITVPDEVAVVGFSNSAHSTIIEPNLTTVNQPGNRIGKLAMQHMIKEIDSNEESFSSKSIEIKTNLIIRASTFL